MSIKNYKQLVAGIAIGAIMTAAVPVFASGSVQAALTAVKFNFNGVQKQLPDGYAVLSYQDHTYIPARFVAENLNSDVAWDENTQTITFKTKSPSSSNNGGLFGDLNSGNGGSDSGTTTSNSGGTVTDSGSDNSDSGSSSTDGSFDTLGSQMVISSNAKIVSVGKTFTDGVIKTTVNKIALDPAYDRSGYGVTFIPAVVLDVTIQNTSNQPVSHFYALNGFDIPGNKAKYQSYTDYTAGYQYGSFDGHFKAGQTVHAILVGPADDGVDVTKLKSFKMHTGDAFTTNSDEVAQGQWITINL